MSSPVTPKITATRFTKESLNALRTELSAAVSAVAAAHGITITIGSAGYTRDGMTATFKVELSSRDETGAVVTREAQAFTQMATTFGLQSSDLGRVFRQQGKAFRITGLAPRSGRYPILAECQATGKTFKFGAEGLVRLFALEALQAQCAPSTTGAV